MESFLDDLEREFENHQPYRPKSHGGRDSPSTSSMSSWHETSKDHTRFHPSLPSARAPLGMHRSDIFANVDKLSAFNQQQQQKQQQQQQQPLPQHPRSAMTSSNGKGFDERQQTNKDGRHNRRIKKNFIKTDITTLCQARWDLSQVCV